MLRKVDTINLSHNLIKKLPENDFLNNLNQLLSFEISDNQLTKLPVFLT